MKQIVVVGGGPSGMMAAGVAAKNGNKVILLEKNDMLGRKLYITGKGRCNVTNASDQEVLLAHVVGNPYFLYSAFYTFGSDDTMEFFESLNVPLVVERGSRVFPSSGKSSDIIRGLERFIKKYDVEIRLRSKVSSVSACGGRVTGVSVCDGGFIAADAVIVATGGISYPSTGSNGDGYGFARSLGHTVSELFPSLVPLTVKEDWIASLQGLSLKNIAVEVFVKNKSVYKDFGELMFTHCGVSGPVVLSASRYLARERGGVMLYIDLKPALTSSELDKRVLRDFEKYLNRDLKNALDDLLPQRLIPVIVSLSGVSGEKKINEITKIERSRLVSLLKRLPVTVVGNMGYDEAVITCGGVTVDEVDPGTMESKIVSGLYFTGEVLDVDALTGGYNLQIAFSTGYLAGSAV